MSETEPDAPATPFLVIGYGNTLRRDDGAGPRVAELVAAAGLPGIRALACHQLTPELAEPIARSRTVIFVDAAADGSGNGTLRPLASAAANAPVLGHAASPEGLLSLAERLFGGAARGWLLAIPAEDFGYGEELSPTTQKGIEDAVATILRHARGTPS